MEEKELKIQVPEGYEIDKENSTFECIKFKNKKQLNYIDIQNSHENYLVSIISINNMFTTKLTAISKLMLVAKYLNDGWTPNFKDTTHKYSFYIKDDEIQICSVFTCINSVIYFKSRDLANKAIKILGEETIKKALSNEY